MKTIKLFGFYQGKFVNDSFVITSKREMVAMNVLISGFLGVVKID